jgi:hypothetical protein
VTADALATIAETDLEALADVEPQSSFRVNEHEPQYYGRRGRGFGSSVPVNLSHAKVAREKKPVAEKPKPAASAAPAIAKPPSPVGRLLATYDDVVDAFRARALELEISRLEIDHLAGLAQNGAANSGFSCLTAMNRATA